MKPSLALLGAIAVLGLTSASFADTQHNGVEFTLAHDSNPAKIHGSFHDRSRNHDNNNWSTSFAPSELIGLEVSSFRNPGTRPIHFALVRDAGRLDCTGIGGGESAHGDCRLMPSEEFTRLLISRGIGRPSFDQAFALVAVDAHRELIDALTAARYPMPGIQDYIALSALKVDGPYIANMARAGYRPESIHSLIEFKALGITAEWISGFARVGYAGVPGDALVQMRALGITPEFISGYQRIGYRNLPVSRLVELKALNITPDFVRSVIRAGESLPDSKELVTMKLFGRKR